MEIRRKDREVSDIRAIFDILRRCDTVTLGMNTDGAPYVIPMTFACALEDERIAVYFHSAAEGRKWELLNQDPRVCVEGHLYYKTVRLDNNVTAKYESVIGTGVVERITDTPGKVAAFKLMLEQYKHSGFPAESCTGLPRAEVFKVVLTEVCGKHNL